MFSFSGLGGRRRVDGGLGKFQQVSPMGSRSEQERAFQGWILRTWGTQVGLTQSRARFSLRIIDPNGLEVKYLSGFSTRSSALMAGEDWVKRSIHGAEVRERYGNSLRTRR